MIPVRAARRSLATCCLLWLSSPIGAFQGAGLGLGENGRLLLGLSGAVTGPHTRFALPARRRTQHFQAVDKSSFRNNKIPILGLFRRTGKLQAWDDGQDEEVGKEWWNRGTGTFETRSRSKRSGRQQSGSSRGNGGSNLVPTKGRMGDGIKDEAMPMDEPYPDVLGKDRENESFLFGMVHRTFLRRTTSLVARLNISTLLRVALPSAMAAILGYAYFDNISLFLYQNWLSAGEIQFLSSDEVQFIPSFLQVIAFLSGTPYPRSPCRPDGR